MHVALARSCLVDYFLPSTCLLEQAPPRCSRILSTSLICFVPALQRRSSSTTNETRLRFAALAPSGTVEFPRDVGTGHDIDRTVELFASLMVEFVERWPFSTLSLFFPRQLSDSLLLCPSVAVAIMPASNFGSGGGISGCSTRLLTSSCIAARSMDDERGTRAGRRPRRKSG
ncbi:hypothetical protein BDY21DRAFT_347558 [Lineolata rhizophorae]|uniref:Uncharacterized protein n=1 Tax=Lineolata rhizophorae TaxID=578093 RepID=A0A6A6NXN9_9PEZI|nr:hypothetical protein BDY21DRAFT_347558 [Lineolata rhizophorae]